MEKGLLLKSNFIMCSKFELQIKGEMGTRPNPIQDYRAVHEACDRFWGKL